MHPDGIFSSIVIGLLLGYLGRLLVPGRQAIGLVLTCVLGLAAALVGAYLGHRAHWSFGATLAVQVALSAIAVALVAGGLRRSRGR